MRKCISSFTALDVTIDEITGAITREQCERHQLFHHINDAVVMGGRLHASIIVERMIGSGEGRLVRDCDEAHLSPQNALLVNRVEGLRSAGDLHDRQRLALRGPHAAEGERIQSIWDFMTPVMAPWRSGDNHTMPLLHMIWSRNS